MLYQKALTGLLDSHGTPIREGDIVEEYHTTLSDEGEVKHIFDVAKCLIVFKKGAFCYDFRPLNGGRLGIYTMYERGQDDFRRHKVLGSVDDVKFGTS